MTRTASPTRNGRTVTVQSDANEDLLVAGTGRGRQAVLVCPHHADALRPAAEFSAPVARMTTGMAIVNHRAGEKDLR